MRSVLVVGAVVIITVAVVVFDAWRLVEGALIAVGAWSVFDWIGNHIGMWDDDEPSGVPIDLDGRYRRN